MVTSFKRSRGHTTHSVPLTFAANHCQPTLPPESTNRLTSHASNVMFQILQVRLQQYVNLELQDIQVGFRKGRGTRDHIANIRWIIDKAREFPKNIYFCIIDNAKAFDLCGSQKTVENSSRDGNTRSCDLPPEKSVCRSRRNS